MQLLVMEVGAPYLLPEAGWKYRVPVLRWALWRAIPWPS